MVAFTVVIRRWVFLQLHPGKAYQIDDILEFKDYVAAGDRHDLSFT